MEKQLPAILVVDERNRPVRLEIYEKVNKGKKESLFGLKNIEIKGRGRKKRKKKPSPKRCYNRKWQVLEFIKENEPTSSNVVVWEVGEGKRHIFTIIYNLLSQGWLKREKHEGEYLYSLGPNAKNFLRNKKINSFLYPQNPLDVGPKGERLD